MQFKTSLIFIFFLAAFLPKGFSQQSENSPYSRYGIGKIHNDNFVFAQGFGNLGATNMDNYHVNLVNPASYGYLQATAFDIGFDINYNRLQTKKDAANIYGGNLNYFSLAIPLINPIGDFIERRERNLDIGLTFALKPHSTVGYNVISTEDHPDEGTIKRNYQGSGSTYKFLTGTGLRYKDFSAGVNAGLLFGTIKYESVVSFPDDIFAYEDHFTESFSVNGFIYNAGLQYVVRLNKKAIKKDETTKPMNLVLGVYGNTSTNFNSTGDVMRLGILPTANINLGLARYDTLVPQQQIIGKGVLPATMGGGISYHHKQKVIAGLNFQKTFWSQYLNEGKLLKEELTDAISISAGIDYIPDYVSYTSFAKRMRYRAGFQYQTDSRSEDGDQLKEAALSLGVGFPIVFQRKASNIDLSLTFGQSIGERLISESFVKFGVGLTFNDQEWLLKRRYY
jgi:hypothetical protein